MTSLGLFLDSNAIDNALAVNLVSGEYDIAQPIGLRANKFITIAR